MLFLKRIRITEQNEPIVLRIIVVVILVLAYLIPLFVYWVLNQK